MFLLQTLAAHDFSPAWMPLNSSCSSKIARSRLSADGCEENLPQQADKNTVLSVANEQNALLVCCAKRVSLRTEAETGTFLKPQVIVGLSGH